MSRSGTILALVLLIASQLAGQETASQAASSSGASAKPVPWAYSLTVDGYIIPNKQGYASPVFTADRNWLHLEARYNDENFHTGSAWLGYDLSFGKKVVFTVTPMVGGLFGRTTGIAPGCEAALKYKKIELSVSNEYVFDTGNKSGNFYYSWPELTYSVLEWLRVGLVAQRTKAFHTRLDTQRGFLVGVSHKKLEFTSYIFNAGWTDPTVVLEAGYTF